MIVFMDTGGAVYTKALLHFDGSDGSTTITDETGKTWTASGNAQIDTAQSMFGGASLLLDGTGDFVSSADSDDWYLPADFTLDCWARVSSLTHIPLFSQITSIGASNNDRWQFTADGGSTINFIITNSATQVVTLSGTFTTATNTWTHYALVHAGNRYIAFGDGAPVGLLESASVMNNFAATAYIGTHRSGGAQRYLTGHVDEARVSKGIARWDGSITVPTSELTNITNTVSLLLMNGSDGSTTFTDETGKTWTKNGDAQIDTAQSVFGGASGLFDGSGDYLESAATADWNIAEGDFTIECWIRPAAIGTTMPVWSAGPTGAAANGDYYFGVDSSGRLAFDQRIAAAYVTINGGTVSASTWTHIACTRSGTIVRLFLGGQLVAVGNYANLALSGTAVARVARGRQSSTSYFNGHIDCLRVLKGTCLYTGSFTPPTSPYVLD